MNDRSGFSNLNCIVWSKVSEWGFFGSECDEKSVMTHLTKLTLSTVGGMEIEDFNVVHCKCSTRRETYTFFFFCSYITIITELILCFLVIIWQGVMSHLLERKEEQTSFLLPLSSKNGLYKHTNLKSNNDGHYWANYIVFPDTSWKGTE